VKVQDGCSFHCTYCIIPRARGAERSVDPEAVLADVRRARAAGHREIVLTGINVGTYDGGRAERGSSGARARSALTLAGLVRRILAETAVERIRLSSIEPQHVDDDLLVAWTGEGAGRCLPTSTCRPVGRRRRAAADGPALLRADYGRVVARVRAALPGAPSTLTSSPASRGGRGAFERSLASSARSSRPASTSSATRPGRGRPRPGWPGRWPSGPPGRAARLLAEAAAAAAVRPAGGGRTAERSSSRSRSRRPAGAGPRAVAMGGPRGGQCDRRGAGPGPAPRGEIAIVHVERIDPLDPERVIGRVERLVARPGDEAGTPAVAAWP